MPERDYAGMVELAREMDDPQQAEIARERAHLRRLRDIRPPGGPSRMPARSEVGSETERKLLELLIPQTPLDIGLTVAGGPGLRAGGRIAAGAIGAMLDPDPAEAGAVGGIRRLFMPREPVRIGRREPAVIGGQYPGIYKDPRVIAQEAAAKVEPEHPALKELFGVTRSDLYDISQQGRRRGNILAPEYGGQITDPKGSYVAQGVMTRANEGRLVDALTEAQRYPELIKGMDPWYVMDPAYQRLVELVGRENAPAAYRRFNTLTSMASPASDVLTEINRGTAAHMMAQRGEFPTFLKYGGTAAKKRGADFPEILRDVVGHPYHSTSQAKPMARYLESGAVDMSQPKVPLYIQASGVPETGFQTVLPVADAHFGRAIGVADVRQGAQKGVSLKAPEYGPIGPWFRERVAAPVGIEAVPAQARMWGLFSPQTGVDSPIGAGKLELLARRIWERAQKLGIDPKVLRDKVLRGEEHAAVAVPEMSAVG